MKYKPGDRVIVRSDLHQGVRYYAEDNSVYAVATASMVSMRGRTVRIRYITQHRYTIYENTFYWTDDMFDGAVIEEERIEISESEKKAICSFLEV